MRQKPIAQLERHILVHRAGMRLLLLHTQFGQHVDDYARFYLKLPCQLVDSDFLHRKYSFYVIPQGARSRESGLSCKCPALGAAFERSRTFRRRSHRNPKFLLQQSVLPDKSFKHLCFWLIIRVFHGTRFSLFPVSAALDYISQR